ncbi:MAG: hypothetical protein JWM11_4499 [Planctomycetaceae bacterium]|nr:hypothetical protein [Planctomycetaceae bacterium]
MKRRSLGQEKIQPWGFPVACCSPTDIRKLSLLAIVVLVLLRVSIGWQFFYEGIWKSHSLHGTEPWSAAGYLKNAKGPFRSTFRNMVDDPYDLDKLDLEKVNARWTEWSEAFKKYYGLDENQIKSLDDLVKKTQGKLKVVLENPAWVGKPADQRIGEFEVYRALIERYEAKLKKVKVDFQQEHLDKQWTELEAKRKELSGPVDALTKELQTDASDLLTLEQIQRGKLTPAPSKVDSINNKTIWALTILGFCMMVGLFSRTAAIGTAGMLLMFYLVVPPWPGVPEAPGPEHSLIVNKNFIELLACLALAALPTGRWLGLDALIHRFIFRGKTD